MDKRWTFVASGEAGLEDSKDKKNPDDFKHMDWFEFYRAPRLLSLFNTINFSQSFTNLNEL